MRGLGGRLDQPRWQRRDERCADPVPSADPRVLPGAGLWRALQVGTLCRCAVPAAATSHCPQCRIALITTAAPYQPGKGDQGPGAPYNAKAKFYAVYSGDTSRDHDLRISHVAIDRKHTTAEDPASYFPLAALRRTASAGRVGSIAPRFHGMPTNRSQRVTIDVDCPEVVARCMADGADAAILVPNCPVCHQTVSLAARMLEESGIATVVMGCAKDIVEHVGVPRFLFSDFPLGNAAGPAERRRIAVIHSRAGAPRSRDRTGAADDRAVASCMERRATTGSSTTATSNVSRPRKSREGAPSSTKGRRKPGTCVPLPVRFARGRRMRLDEEREPMKATP